MESSIAEFLKRQSACELLPTVVREVAGTKLLTNSFYLSFFFGRMLGHPCGMADALSRTVTCSRGMHSDFSLCQLQRFVGIVRFTSANFLGLRPRPVWGRRPREVQGGEHLQPI